MFAGGLNRPAPVGPAQAYKTYRLAFPAATHRKPARCAQVGCAQREQGWMTVLDPNIPAQAEALNWIRLHSGRSYSEAPTVGESTVTLIFPPGQDCFQQHTVTLEREPIALVHAGDWRLAGPQRPVIRRHTRTDDWVEDFATHQDAIATEQQRG